MSNINWSAYRWTTKLLENISTPERKLQCSKQYIMCRMDIKNMFCVRTHTVPLHGFASHTCMRSPHYDQLTTSFPCPQIGVACHNHVNLYRIQSLCLRARLNCMIIEAKCPFLSSEITHTKDGVCNERAYVHSPLV